MNSSRPRLLMVGLVPPEVGGFLACGVATHVIELAEQAAARGYETSILAPLRPGAQPSRNGVRLIDASLSRSVRTLSGLRAAFRRVPRSALFEGLRWKDRISILSWTERIRAAIKATRADIVHIHPLSHPAGPGLGELPGCIPVVLSDHGFWQDVRDDTDLAKIREASRLAAAVVAVSNYCLERQDRLGLACRGVCEVIPNAIVPVPFELGRDRPRRDRKRILFVAGVEPVTRKGLDILILALASSPELRGAAELRVIVDAPTGRWAAAAMAEAGIAGDVLPLLPRREVIAAYSDADVLVLPSRSEAFGLVYLEALATGTPVVGFAPIIKELVASLGPEVGKPFDAEFGTPADLADEIRLVLDHPLNRADLAARTAAAFSWDNVFPAFDRLYNRLRPM